MGVPGVSISVGITALGFTAWLAGRIHTQYREVFDSHNGWRRVSILNPMWWVGYRWKAWVWESSRLSYDYDGTWFYETDVQRAHRVLREQCNGQV
jgi:hypothetical protein